MIKRLNIRNGLPLILTFVILAIFSCKKDVGLPLSDSYSENSSSQSNYDPFSFTCDTLPQEPSFGWDDTTSNDQKNIYFWAYNPVNTSEIIYVNYSGELYCYNLNTHSRKYLDKNIMSLPQINQFGWIVYDNLSFQVFIVKPNGDSLKQLNMSIPGHEPYWDYTGKNIYYRENDSFVKISTSGIKIDNTNLHPNCFVFAKTSGNYLFSSSINVYLKNVSDNSQTYLFNDPKNILHITFSDDDKIVYWWNYISLQSFNLETKKRDTLLKFCENFSVRGLNIINNYNKLTMSCVFRKQIGSKWKLYRENIPIEMDVNTKEWRKLLIQF